MGCAASKSSKPKALVPHVFALFGAPGAGKSTVFKQFCLSENGFTPEMRQKYKEKIFDHAEKVFKMLSGAKFLWADAEKKDDMESSLSFILKAMNDLTIVMKAENVSDKACKKAFRRLAEFNESPHFHAMRAFLYDFDVVSEPIKYVIDNLSRMTSVDYEPTDEDILSVRIATIGFEETKLSFDGHPFVIVDVGGEEVYQKARIKTVIDEERKVNVIFVLSCCDLERNASTRDERTRYVESIDCLKEFVENEALRGYLRKVFVFVNKIDRFVDEFDATAFVATFPDFEGDAPEEALTHFEEKIRATCAELGNAVVFQTCAISSEKKVRGNIGSVLAKVRDGVAKENIEKLGIY